MPADRNVRFLGDGNHPLVVTLTLPGGTVRIPGAYVIADTDGAGGASDHDDTHRPQHLSVVTRYPTRSAALKAVRHQADALGLDPADLRDPRFVDGATNGIVAIEVGVIDQDPDTQVNYEFDFERT